MSSRQYITCHWDACSNHLTISDSLRAEVLRTPSSSLPRYDHGWPSVSGTFLKGASAKHLVRLTHTLCPWLSSQQNVPQCNLWLSLLSQLHFTNILPHPFSFSLFYTPKNVSSLSHLISYCTYQFYFFLFYLSFLFFSSLILSFHKLSFFFSTTLPLFTSSLSLVAVIYGIGVSMPWLAHLFPHSLSTLSIIMLLFSPLTPTHLLPEKNLFIPTLYLSSPFRAGRFLWPALEV